MSNRARAVAYFGEDKNWAIKCFNLFKLNDTKKSALNENVNLLVLVRFVTKSFEILFANTKPPVETLPNNWHKSHKNHSICALTIPSKFYFPTHPCPSHSIAHKYSVICEVLEIMSATCCLWPNFGTSSVCRKNKKKKVNVINLPF